MSDELDGLRISGGGSVAVASDAFFGLIAELDRIATELISLRGRAAAAVPPGWPGGGELDRALGLLHAAEERARGLASTCRAVVERYGELEHGVVALARWADACSVTVLGRHLPLLAMAGAPWIGLGIVTASVQAALWPEYADRTRAMLAEVLRRRVLTDPRTVELVRAAVAASDDLALATVPLPPGLVHLLDRRLGWFGTDFVARHTAAVASRSGLLVETPVRVAPEPPRRVAPPSGFADRLDRIPTGAGQVRVERYRTEEGGERFEVYIGGTRDAGAVAAREPWDMTSNVVGLGGGPAGSLRAVQEALRDAGAGPESPVVFTGYSQGGLVAAALAAGGDYDVRGLVTFGAPIGAVELPTGLPVVAVEHTDDLVPALGGDRTGTSAVVVERQAFGGREVESDAPLPAHELAEYRATAVLMDGAVSPQLREAAAALPASGAAGAAVVYRAERVGAQ